MFNSIHEYGGRPRRHTFGFVFGRVWLGALFVALGVLWLLDNMRLVDSERILEWWPVLLIAFGAVKLMDPVRRRPFGGWLFIIAGAWILAHNLGYVGWGVWELWPLILIALGARIVWRGVHGHETPHHRHGLRMGPLGPRSAAGTGPSVAGAAGAPDAAGTSTSSVPGTDTETFSGFAVWSGVDRKCTSQAFRGGDFTALMGGGSVDLRAAKPVPGGAVVDLTVVMGGVEVVVPDDWQVVNEIQCVMGGVEDSRTPAAPTTDRVLYLKGFVLMGGVEIRNQPDK